MDDDDGVEELDIDAIVHGRRGRRDDQTSTKAITATLPNTRSPAPGTVKTPQGSDTSAKPPSGSPHPDTADTPFKRQDS